MVTAFDFAAWRARMAALRGAPYSQAAAARDLGKTPGMVKKYEQPPERAGKPPPYPVPRDTVLACAALEAAAGGGIKAIKAALRPGPL